MLNFDKIIRKYPATYTVSLSVKYMNLASALALNFVFGLVYVRNKNIVFVCLWSRDTYQSCYPW